MAHMSEVEIQHAKNMFGIDASFRCDGCSLPVEGVARNIKGKQYCENCAEAASQGIAPYKIIRDAEGKLFYKQGEISVPVYKEASFAASLEELKKLPLSKIHYLAGANNVELVAGFPEARVREIVSSFVQLAWFDKVLGAPSDSLIPQNHERRLRAYKSDLAEFKLHAPAVVVGPVQRAPRVPRGSAGGNPPPPTPGTRPRASQGPKTPGQGRVKLPGTGYIVGSSMAVLYEALVSGKPVAKKTLRGLITADLDNRLKVLEKHGRDSGNWTIAYHGDTVSMSGKHVDAAKTK